MDQEKGFTTLVIVILILAGGLLAYGGYRYGVRDKEIVIQTPSNLIPTNIPPTLGPTISQVLPSTSQVSSTLKPSPTVKGVKPQVLVSTEGWQHLKLDKFYIDIDFPANYRLNSKATSDTWEHFDEVVTENGSNSGVISIALLDNPKGFGRRDFIWKEVLGYTDAKSLDEGIKDGTVSRVKEWSIDGVEALSLYYTEYSGGGEYLALSHKGKILIVHSKAGFDNNKTHQTILSTIDLK